MGTTFTPGQMSQLQTNVNIGVATALPKVVAKLDPKSTLKALEGRGEIFAGHIEVALEQALNAMISSAFALAPRSSTTLTLAEHHDPDAFYRTRSGLYVWNEFRSDVVAKAKPTEAGVTFTIDGHTLTRNLSDAEIEAALPKDHLFDEKQACAVVAALIAKQPNGEEGVLLNNGYANLLYTSLCVVSVSWYAGRREWRVFTFRRGGRRWRAGNQVFSPATAA